MAWLKFKTIKKSEKELPADPRSSKKQTKTQSLSTNISTSTTAAPPIPENTTDPKTPRICSCSHSGEQERIIIHLPIKRNDRRFHKKILFLHGKNVDDLKQQSIYQNGRRKKKKKAERKGLII